MNFLAWIKNSEGYINGFTIGSLSIAFYAICILTGIIVGMYFILREAKKVGISSDFIYECALFGIPFGIIGARLWYVLFNLSSFNSFGEVLGFSDGGFTGLSGLGIQGGIIAASITLFIICKIKKVSVIKLLDLAMPGIMIAQCFGRWGNFFNSELYGPIVTNTGFISNIPLLKTYMYIDGAYRHPAFLYESLLNLCGVITIFILRRKFKKLRMGDITGIYLMWYGSVRIFTESLRMMGDPNDPLKIGSIPVSILTSVIFIIVGLLYIILKRLLPIWLKNYNGNNKVVLEFKNFPQTTYIELTSDVKAHKIDTVLFDNDGTLMNTKDLIDKSFVYTFEHFRPDYTLTDEELDSFFGPTLDQTFSKYAKDETEKEEMIKYYREFNEANHDSLAKPFNGAKETLKKLHNSGIKIGVVSSKQNALLIHGLEHFGLMKYIDLVVGSDDVKNHKPAPDAILLAKEKLGGVNVCYVGDTKIDIEAAKAAKVKAIGVLYIKNPRIMLEVKPDDVIEKLSDMITICGE